MARVGRRLKLLSILLIFVAADLVLANFPGPVPSNQAISNVEHDPSFLSLTNSTVINGTVIPGNYDYGGYGNRFGCFHTSILGWLNPFHEYTTTTLTFFVEFYGTLSNGTKVGRPYMIFVQVDPNTGQIYEIQRQFGVCL